MGQARSGSRGDLDSHDRRRRICGGVARALRPLLAAQLRLIFHLQEQLFVSPQLRPARQMLLQ